MALVSDLLVRAICTESSTLDLVSPVSPMALSKHVTMTNGTGAGSANMIFSDTRTLAASGTEDLDLAGVLTGALGNTLTFARIKGLIVSAAATNTNNVNVTRPATNGVPLFLAASDGIPVKPGGVFCWIAPDATGIAVTAATGDLVTFTNSGSGTSVTYDVVIIGANA